MAAQLTLTDTAPAAKSLRIDVDGNFAQIREKDGLANSLISFDLVNNRIGVFTPPTATFSFNVTKTLTAGVTERVANFGALGDNASMTYAIALYSFAEGRNGAITNSLRSMECLAYGNGAGNITNASVLAATTGNFGTGTVTNAHTISIGDVQTFGGGPVTNTIAVRVARDTGTRTKKIGLFYGATEPDSGNYAIYVQQDLATNELVYFGGKVGIGTINPVISGTGKLHMSADTMRLDTARTPASASAPGNTGEICWDANFIYVCIAPNTWRRVAHATW